MESDFARRLQIPKGTEGLSFAEAYRHRSAVRLAEDLFTSWGYLPAQLAMADFFDSYRTLMSDESLQSVYRLVDREGELLMLRSDITLFLAKHLGAHAGKSAGPVRICYGDTILRYEDSEDISHNEFFQLGAELIGVPGSRGDIEIAALLGELISRLELPRPVLHIGSRRLFDLVATEASPAERERGISSIIDREWDLFREIIGIDGTMFEFIGSRDEYSEARDNLVEYSFAGEGEKSRDAKTRRAVIDKSAIRCELERIDEIAEMLERLNAPFDIRIDLSELGSRSYYTGVVFSVYVDDAATAIASGGRYDDLLRHFGDHRPAVGFSLMLRKIMHRLEHNRKFDPPAAVKIHEADTYEALLAAAKIRSNGDIAEL